MDKRCIPTKYGFVKLLNTCEKAKLRRDFGKQAAATSNVKQRFLNELFILETPFPTVNPVMIPKLWFKCIKMCSSSLEKVGALWGVHGRPQPGVDELFLWSLETTSSACWSDDINFPRGHWTIWRAVSQLLLEFSFRAAELSVDSLGFWCGMVSLRLSNLQQFHARLILPELTTFNSTTTTAQQRSCWMFELSLKRARAIWLS